MAVYHSSTVHKNFSLGGGHWYTRRVSHFTPDGSRVSLGGPWSSLSSWLVTRGTSPALPPQVSGCLTKHTAAVAEYPNRPPVLAIFMIRASQGVGRIAVIPGGGPRQGSFGEIEFPIGGGRPDFSSFNPPGQGPPLNPGPPLSTNMPHHPQGNPNYHSVHTSQLGLPPRPRSFIPLPAGGPNQESFGRLIFTPEPGHPVFKFIPPGLNRSPGPPARIGASQLNNRDMAILMAKYGSEILNTDPVIQSMPHLPPAMSREVLNVDPSIRAMAYTMASQLGGEPGQVGVAAVIAGLVGLGLGIAGTLLLKRK